MYDLSLIKSFLSREVYTKYRNYVQREDFSKELLPILDSLDEWYVNNTDPPTLEDIANIAFAGKVRDKDWEYTKGVFNSLQNINGSETAQNLLRAFKTQRQCEDISTLAYDVSRGSKGLPDLLAAVGKLEQPPVEEITYVTDDINDILDSTVRVPGLRWRLESLNKSLGSLRKGDFGFVFARPETGKTTFLADQVTFMAEQLKDDSGPILWFNNEEQGKKVKLRCLESCLGATKEQVSKYPDRAMKAYLEKTHGKIKVYDSASIHWRQVETICKQENPSLILFDQIDKIKGFSSDREDLVMGAIYQWAREVAKTYAPVIGICQADGTAEGEQWLHMGHVSNAKTAKQAEADFILGIGKIHEPGYEYLRYFNISKNKLVGDPDTDPHLRHGKITVILKPDIGRYEDVESFQ